jgi:hypothetical protein
LIRSRRNNLLFVGYKTDEYMNWIANLPHDD